MTKSSIIILVTVDSLRRDYVGCYRNGSLTPFIDRLSCDSLVFDNATSQGGGTPESFRSIMFGLPPPFRLEERFVQGKESIAKVLAEAGYSTAGFHSNPFLSTHFGYDSGFETFYDAGKGGDGLASFVSGIGNAASIVLLNRGPAASGREIVREALEWAKKARSPAFLWVHFMDTHFPYLPPMRFQGVLGSIRNRIGWDVLMAEKIQSRNGPPSESTRKMIQSSYAHCVREVDACIEELDSGLSKLFEDRLQIITADHGEGFWEHRRFGHSGIYEEILRVPLLVHRSEGRGKRVSAAVALADIKATILERAGLSTERGGSLSGGLEGRGTSERRFVCTSLDPPTGTRAIGVRYGSEKYIRNETLDGKTCSSEEFYELSSDGGERVNLIQERKSEAAAALELLRQTEMKAPVASMSRSDEQEITQRLRALGYD